MKILFCTDGSKISFNSLENFSNWICCKESLEIDIICAIDWSFLPEEVSIEEHGFTNSCANIADNILDCAENDIKSYGIKVGEKIKICGSAVEAILEQIKTKNYDLILMGSHGRKGIQKWLGSVSRDIISNSKITSYISKYKNLSKTVLFPIDGSQMSIEGVKYIINNFDLTEKRISICMVNEDPEMLFLEGNLDSNWLLQIEKNQQLYSSKILKKVQNIIEKKGYFVSESLILSGNISQTIIDFSAKEKIDLICLTARNLTKFQKFLLGSVSNRILEYSPSDIIICKIDNPIS